MSKYGEIITNIHYDTYDEVIAECDGRYGNKIKNFLINNDGSVEVSYARELPENESEAKPCRAPMPLPPQLKVRAEVSFETNDLPTLSAVLNNIDKYWPGMHMYQYGFAQKIGSPALAIATIINYSNEEEDNQEGPNLTLQTIEEDEEELGDIMYDE